MTVLQPGPARHSDPVTRPAPSPAGIGGRRSLPHVVLGALLVVACAVGFAVTALRVDPRSPVLALARAVSAGHALTAADVVVVRVVPDPSLAVLAAASAQGSVVGRTLRLPAAARMLLSESMLGPAAWPPAGQSLVAVPVKAGREPDVLAARVQVQVVPASSAGTSSTGTPGSAAGGTAGGVAGGAVVQARGTVVSVSAADTGGGVVVSLPMVSADAVRVAGTRGDVALVVQSVG